MSQLLPSTLPLHNLLRKNTLAKQSDQTLNKLWNAGVPVSTSWEVYAQPELKQAWNAISSQSALEALEQGALNVGDTDLSLHEKIALASSGAQKILSERTALMNTLRANILNYIKQGQLFAYGFEQQRTLSSIPIEVPASLWKGKCDWQASKLTAQSLNFIEIRLTTKRIRDEIMCGEAPQTKTVGRPSIGAYITAAFAGLNEAGRINTSNSAISHFPMVREWIKNNRPDCHLKANTIGDEGIRAYFAPLFKDLKKYRKQ